MSEHATAPDVESSVHSYGSGSGLFFMRWDEKDQTSANTWLHVDMNAEGVVHALEEEGLPPHIVRYLTRAETRPAARAFGSGLGLILRGINFNEAQDPVDMVSLRCYVEPRRLVTVRSRWLASVQETRRQLEEGTDLRTPVDVLLTIVEKLTAKISSHIDGLDLQLEASEAATQQQEDEDFGVLRNQIAAVYRFIAPQRKALTMLAQIGQAHFTEDQLEQLAECEDLTQRHVEDLELHRERATSLQQARLNAMQAEQNRRAYALSVVAGLFLPATFVTGLFGMNVAGLPGTENASAFVIVLAGMVLVSGGVYAVLKLKKWF